MAMDRRAGNEGLAGSGYFEVIPQGPSGWHWQLVTDTGKVIAESPSLATPEACLKSLKWLRTHLDELPIINAGETATP